MTFKDIFILFICKKDKSYSFDIGRHNLKVKEGKAFKWIYNRKITHFYPYKVLGDFAFCYKLNILGKLLINYLK